MSQFVIPLAAIAARRSCLLSNGAYRVMLTDTGGGVSRWRELAVTRWRDDAHREDWGSYLLLRDEHSGAVWSPTRQPFPQANLNVTTTFRTDRAEFARRCGTIDSILEIAVAHDRVASPPLGQPWRLAALAVDHVVQRTGARRCGRG
jgi:hypothetical protein